MINLQQIYNLLRPGIKAFIGQYDNIPEVWNKMYESDTSDKAFEYEDEIKGLGFAKEKLEGAPIAQDSMSVMFQKVYRHKTYGLSFAMTDEAMKDNLYKKEFPKQLVSLKKSLSALKNQIATNVLNLGATTEFSVDGIPLFSAVHPLANGDTNRNILGNAGAALSEIAIQEMYTQIMLFKELSGLPVDISPRLLVVHPNQTVAAETIFGSQFTTSINRPGGGAAALGANDINIVSRNKIFPDGYESNKYITSTTGAYVITDADRGLIHYKREGISQKSWVDNTTDSIWFSAKERYCFGASNWRGVFRISA